MIVILAEKPSVGREIARVVGATSRADGYLHGGGYTVTWAFGHLVGLALPADYGFERPRAEDLPLVPEPFRLVVRQSKTAKGYAPDPAAKKQLRVIKKLFDACESIIVATDAGREGELIFRFIYAWTKSEKPFQRLWISSLTDTAIRAGFEALRPGAEFDNLYRAADCRAKADWLVGINVSQALRIASGAGNNSLGRVQTPTLAMICTRWNEHRDFIPGKYWQLMITLEKDGTTCHFTDKRDFEDKTAAQQAYSELKEQPTARIKNVEVKKNRQASPPLYDLTALQKDASSRYGLTAERTLQIAQALYERKLITYPRTGSRYIPEDVAASIPGLLDRVLSMPEFMRCAEIDRPGSRPVDGSKVTDHHALLITGLSPAELEGDPRRVYCLIAGRMLEAFSSDCVREVTAVEATCGGRTFTARASRILTPGWRAILGRADDADNDPDEGGTMPVFVEGEELLVGGYNLVAKHTQPKPLYTEATLLTAMENVGKDIENKAQREAMKETGLGTPATRAAIIETLVTRQYIERRGKTIVPTAKGMNLYTLAKSLRVADPGMTGYWEQGLAAVNRGEQSVETFLRAIEIFTRQVTTEILALQRGPIPDSKTWPCPKCGIGQVKLHTKIARCDNPGCGLVLLRTYLNKTLSEADFSQLFATGRTGLIRDFSGNRRRPFDGYIIFDEKFRTTIVPAGEDPDAATPAPETGG